MAKRNRPRVLTVVDSGTWPFLRIDTQFRNLVRGQWVVVLVLAMISVIAPRQVKEIARRRLLCHSGMLYNETITYSQVLCSRL